MSFLDYLDKLRAKPENVKKSIAISISLIITIVIASVWFVSKYVTSIQETERDATVTEIQSPVSSMSATVSDAFKNLSDEFGNLKEKLSELFSESYSSN